MRSGSPSRGAVPASVPVRTRGSLTDTKESASAGLLHNDSQPFLRTTSISRTFDNAVITNLGLQFILEPSEPIQIVKRGRANRR
jgi:hypothetical protein